MHNKMKITFILFILLIAFVGNSFSMLKYCEVKEERKGLFVKSNDERNYFDDFVDNAEKQIDIMSKQAAVIWERETARFKGPYLYTEASDLEKYSPKGPGLNITYNDYYPLPRLTDAEIRLPTNLTELIIFNENDTLSDEDLKKYTTLTSLRLSSLNNITEAGISNLTNLTLLDLSYNNNLTDKVLSQFIKLESLKLSSNPIITDEGISHLLNLTALNLNQNDKITDKGLRSLVKFKMLNLTHNKLITYKGLSHLRNLTWLCPKAASSSEGKYGLVRHGDEKYKGLSEGEIAQKELSHLPNPIIGHF